MVNEPSIDSALVDALTGHPLARKLLGWESEMKFIDGLYRTTDRYFRTKKREKVASLLDRILTERKTERAPKKKVGVPAD